MQSQSKTNFALTFGFYEHDYIVRRETLLHEVIKVGSDPRSHLRIDDGNVARMHAVIEAGSPQNITIIDLGHEAGTWVNGTRVSKCTIEVGDEIQIGGKRIRLERVEPAAQSAAPFTDTAKPLPSASADFRRPNPFGRIDAFAVSEHLAPEDCTYALVKSGPDVNLDEVEMRHVASVEVAVMWGTTVLHVRHLTPPRSFYVGEEEGQNFTCDYLIPSEKLGTTRAPVVLVRDGVIDFVIPPRASGYVELPGERKLSLEEAIRTGRAQPCVELSGAYQMTLASGAKARIEIGDLVFQIGAVAAGKPVPRGLFASSDSSRHMYTGFSFLAHTGLFAAMAFFVPPMGLVEDEGLSRDRQYLIQQYLQAASEREQEAKATDQPATADADDREGGTGTRAANEEGSMGTPNSRDTNRRYSVRGDAPPANAHLARVAALQNAANFGLIGILNSGGGGDSNAPTAPWGRDDSLGSDAESHLGNMWGDTIGDAFGAGGLGLTGIGEGGGGRGEGIGLSGIAGLGLGHGAGFGDGDGIGNGHGRLSRGHVSHVPVLHYGGETVINGRLPPEVIQRIVRQNYGRFRLCYENGLRGNPSLQGRVAVRFVIGRDGAVSTAMNGGSDLPDASVVQCVVRAYYGLSFPQPDNGIVTVAYPIMFTPGE